LGENISIIKEFQRSSVEVSREVGLEANTDRTKCMVVSRHQNVGQNDSLLIVNEYFENVAKSKHSGTTFNK